MKLEMNEHSIDKMIREREETFDFDEMTAQLAGKIMRDNQIDDEDENVYEDLKDLIRDHIVSWFENGDTTNVDDPRDE